jgi:hypothetical protein
VRAAPLHLLALLSLLAFLPACAGRIVHESSLTTQPAALSTDLGLEGRYRATAHSNEAGSISGLMFAERTPKGFVANTRPGAATDLIRASEGFLAGMLGGLVFPGGAIARWESTTPTTDTSGKPLPGEGQVYIGPYMAAKTKMSSPSDPIEVYTPSGKLVGFITLEPAPPNSNPDPTSTDAPPQYAALADAAEAALRDHLYDPALADSSKVRAYLRSLRSVAKISRDDLEFSFGAAVAAATNLPFSQTIFQRELDDDAELRLRGTARRERGKISGSTQADDGIATIGFDAFLMNPSRIDDAMKSSLADAPAAIIIDLRDCRGGNYSCMRVASWLIDSPAEAGAIIGPSRRTAALAGGLASLTRMPFTRLETPELLRSRLDSEGGVVITVDPAPGAGHGSIERSAGDEHGALPATPPGLRPTSAPPHIFAGPVAVLTSKRTQGVAELLVWFLKEKRGAIVVGEKTAGRAIHTRPVEVGEGWSLRVPCFDVLTADARRIDRIGITPTVSCAADDATKVAREKLQAAIAAASTN